ncbi:unnamed protein product [Meloidogyne enterolobii]
MPLPPYCSVGLSTDSDRHPVDREKDTTTANSLMGATETSKMEEGKSKMEAAEHSKMGGKSEEAKVEEKSKMEESKAKMEEKSKMGEKSKMATTANSMMETNSKMEGEDKSKSSQQE